jgi:hypothetical protein
MKHVKLFEDFGRGNMMSSGGRFLPSDMVIGIISEGTDVAVFSERDGIEVMDHLNSIASDYYIPFAFKYIPGAKYCLIDYSMDIKKARPEDVLLTEEKLREIMETKKITVYVKDGNHFGAEEDDDNEGYALELVGDDRYMSAQSWGVSVEDGAKEHFLSHESDD